MNKISIFSIILIVPYFFALAQPRNRVENVQIIRMNNDSVINSDIHINEFKDSLTLKLQSFFPTNFGVVSILYPQVMDTNNRSKSYMGSAEINGIFWYFVYKSDVFRIFDTVHNVNLCLVPSKPSKEDEIAGINYEMNHWVCPICSKKSKCTDKHDAPSIVKRGDVYFSLKKYPWAKTFYERAIKIDSSYAPAHLGLAKVAKVLNDSTIYRIELNKARILNPNDSEVIYKTSPEKVKNR